MEQIDSISISYPPEFRSFSGESLCASSETNSVVQKIEGDELIPRLDFQRLNSETINLAEACEGWGLFYLANHGIPHDILSGVEEHVRSVFSLPFEKKQELFTSPMSYFWGTPALTPSGVALGTRSSYGVNWMEGISLPCAHLSNFTPSDLLVNKLRILLQKYETHVSRIARSVFESMLESIDKDHCKDYSSYLSEATGCLRVYRYPACGVVEGESWGIEEHTDSSILTILNQDHVGGLELFRDGSWYPVRPLSDTLVVNLGDMAQAISDDKFCSARHRVRNNKSKNRQSIAYFVFPPNDRLIQTSTYRPFTYVDFQQQVQRDIKLLGTKVGLDRFRI